MINFVEKLFPIGKLNLFWLLFGALLSMPFWSCAQNLSLPAEFTELLDRANLLFFEPLEAGYSVVRLPTNEYQNCQFAIQSGRERLQIRYFILPWDEKIPETVQPHLTTFRALTSIATNADDALISAIQPERESLLRDFNADWGMVYIFKPKPGFSERNFCKMVAICKEGKGTAFVFYLFDNPNNEAPDARYFALRFL